MSSIDNRSHTLPSYLPADALGPWGTYLQQVDRVTPYLGSLSRWVETLKRPNISAVAILFEDTMGQMYSADSVGTNHRFGAGDVHWTLAGNGVEHTQTPEDDANIHAVQMFIDLPQWLRFIPAMTFHLIAKDVPIYKTAACRIRVLVGSAFGLTSPLKIPQDILILEGWTESDFEIPVPQGWKLWLYDRSDERAGYSSQPIVRGQFLAVASPTAVKF